MKIIYMTQTNYFYENFSKKAKAPSNEKKQKKQTNTRCEEFIFKRIKKRNK